ncbi:hypothetical protein Pcinc_032328 [Petrolisthes cinctipes]|uniref:Phospholipase A2 n=1 Tax=Petrolisthes cinctipes TaxID=88211 RepID=A0AAE1EUP1_PETCI|nr:hypothetical protein Pcinc_032328 [Petrolisthes cinctipes]
MTKTASTWTSEVTLDSAPLDIEARDALALSTEGGEGGAGGVGGGRHKRSVFHLFNMVTCATRCNPLDYKGYGCYCGFLGSGLVVDGIDKCCKGHDWCYEHARCQGLDHYLAPYKWKCNGGKPYCDKQQQQQQVTEDREIERETDETSRQCQQEVQLER